MTQTPGEMQYEFDTSDGTIFQCAVAPRRSLAFFVIELTEYATQHTAAEYKASFGELDNLYLYPIC